jgi:hypothetical protein
MRRDLADGGFILSYRSVRHDVPSPLHSSLCCMQHSAVQWLIALSGGGGSPAQDCPPHRDYVRLEFEGAHMITPLEDGRGFTYAYIQHVRTLLHAHNPFGCPDAWSVR